MIKALIQRPAIIFLIAILLLSAGIASMMFLPVKLQPIVSEPNIVVNVIAEKEMDISIMEAQISLPLENVAIHSDIVKHIRTTTDTRRARLHIEIKDTAKEKQLDDLKEELNKRISSSSIAIQSHEITQSSTADQTFMQIAILPKDFDDLLVQQELRNSVVPELGNIPGVRQVTHQLMDYQMEYIMQLDSQHMQGIQSTLATIQDIRQGLMRPMLGTLQGVETVRSEAMISNRLTLEQFQLSNGQRVRDIFSIQSRIPAQDQFFNGLNGSETYMISLNISKTADELEMSSLVRAQMDRLFANQLTEWEYVYVWDSSEFIGQAIKEVVTNILLGAIVAILLLLLIFRSIKTTLIIGISIPISLCTALMMMYLFEYSINIVTLIGLGLGTGMIVDACIVVLENIFKKMEQGLDKLEAIIEGTKEVATPVFTSVLTTVVVFIPIGYLDGVVGAMGKELALTVIVSLIASLGVALTMIPIFSYYLMKPSKPSKVHEKMVYHYGRLLAFLLNRKLFVILSFIIVLSASLFVLIQYVPKNYMPNVSERAYYVRYDVEKGINMVENKIIMEETSAYILEIPGVENVFYWGNSDRPERGNFYIHYWPRSVMPTSDEAVNEAVNDVITEYIDFVSARFSAGQSDTSGQLQLSLTSNSMFTILDQIPAIEQDLHEISGLHSVEWNQLQDREEMIIDFSANQLREAGLDRDQVEQYVSLILSGVPTMTLFEQNEERSLNLTFPNEFSRNSSGLRQLSLTETSTLEDVAEFRFASAESVRVRKDGQYEMELVVYIDAEYKDAILDEIQTLINQRANSQVELSFAGAQRQQTEAFNKLILAALAAFAVIFVILTAQFNRFRQPFMIMMTLPFTLIGVCLGFIITGRQFDILAMIGVVMLIGIVVNNSIVLIDFINKRLAIYDSPREAIIDAAKTRMRPIFTTSFTTIGGLIPMFIGGSNSSDFQTPIATAVIFGLLFSTLVSLILLPVVYDLFEGKRRKKPLVE